MADRGKKAVTDAGIITSPLSKFDSSWCETNVFFMIIMIDSLEATE